jgi:hypothetical protein
LKGLVDEIDLLGVWSRGDESGTALLKTIKIFAPNAVCWTGEEGLAELLASDAVEAVAVVLPVQAVLDVSGDMKDAWPDDSESVPG